jgi:hypothetical protein
LFKNQKGTHLWSRPISFPIQEAVEGKSREGSEFESQGALCLIHWSRILPDMFNQVENMNLDTLKLRISFKRRLMFE